MAGHPFSLTTPAEVAKVLYDELHLECCVKLPQGKTTAKRKNAQVNSTSKKVLSLVLIQLCWPSPLLLTRSTPTRP